MIRCGSQQNDAMNTIENELAELKRLLAAFGAATARLSRRLDRIEASQVKTAAIVRDIHGDATPPQVPPPRPLQPHQRMNTPITDKLASRVSDFVGNSKVLHGSHAKKLETDRAALMEAIVRSLADPSISPRSKTGLADALAAARANFPTP